MSKRIEWRAAWLACIIEWKIRFFFPQGEEHFMNVLRRLKLESDLQDRGSRVLFCDFFKGGPGGKRGWSSNYTENTGTTSGHLSGCLTGGWEHLYGGKFLRPPSWHRCSVHLVNWWREWEFTALWRILEEDFKVQAPLRWLVYTALKAVCWITLYMCRYTLYRYICRAVA